ncbi:hypothetical protein K469DRAFT_692135 [Zopfia rhizophila CBS 207.26]|uniref:Uncharacterized protein n=1 Tax=Zopfia rhizophila CBS 207.26 TaxID=1314779 RepID=A0A6A6DSR9_9PEZI|nr:hypothetical protein K469DRAFT_692135 [Zopfia rhizophila CBS 207.26]
MSYFTYHNNNAQFPCPDGSFPMVSQENNFPIDHFTPNMDWLDNDPTLREFGDSMLPSEPESKAALPGSPEIVPLLQEVKKLMDDVRKSVEYLNEQYGKTKEELQTVRETFVMLQADIRENSSALANVDKYIEAHKTWTWDFRKDVQARLQQIADSSKSGN